MAAITRTAANVRPLDSKCVIRKYKAAATTIEPGLAVYISAADNVAIGDKDTYANACVIGIALTDANRVGEYVDVLESGPMGGFTLTAGADVWLFDDGTLTETFDGSDVTANGDLAAGDFATKIGTAISTTVLLVNIEHPRAALAA